MRASVGAPSMVRSRTGALACTDSGACPAALRRLERAIVKQPACAAAISCSGLVPSPSPKRDSYEYGPWSTPSPTVIVSEALSTDPCHSALPFRAVIFASVSHPR